MNTNTHLPEVTLPARKEFLSDRRQLRLFVLAEVVFATSVALALLRAAHGHEI